MSSNRRIAPALGRAIVVAISLVSAGISTANAQEAPEPQGEIEVAPMGICQTCEPDDPPPQNQPPEASITAPSSGQQFIAGTPVVFSANAYDPDGSLQHVDFRVDQVLIKRDTTAPYDATWTSTVGGHNLAVFPVDNLGYEGLGQGITVNVVPNQVPTVSLTAPANGAKIDTGAVVTMTATAADNDGSVQRVEFYVDGVKKGQDTTAPYAFAWTSTLGTHSLVAKAVDNLNVVGTSAARTITVNKAPTVSLTSPTAGQNLLTGSSVSLTATASDPDGNLSRVDFLIDGVKVGQDTTSPFSYSWVAAAGSHTVQAKAYDALSGTAASATVSVVAGSAPTVSLTAPAAGQNIIVGTSVSLTASASDVDGDLARVDFLVDGVKIGQDMTAPYSLAWTSTNGSHTVQAKAYDAIGRAGTSSVASIEVSSAPTVSVTSPTAGQTFPTGGTLTLQATAADADGNLSRVDFLVDGVKVGQDTTTPYSFAWTRAYGSHTVQAKAYDAVGFNKTSTSIAFKVNDAPTVSIGAPVEGKEYLAGTAVPMSATASDPNGAISRVEFLVDGVVVATDTTSPYAASWTGSLGNREIKARAVDGLDATKTSAGRSIRIVDHLTTITRRYYYDEHQRLCRVMEPETGSTVMAYDDAGNLIWSASGLDLPATDACYHAQALTSGRRVDRNYDQRNRVTGLLFPDYQGDTTYEYTPDGLLESIVSNNGEAPNTNVVTHNYTYNSRRLLVNEQMAWNTINWNVGSTYNANGHLTNETFPGNLSVAYAPNALGQPTKAGAYASGVTYYPNGAVKQFTYGNGIVHTLTQNDRQLPDRSMDAYGATKYLDDGYNYDANGNVAAISDGATDHVGEMDRDMTYDGLNRLKTVTSPMYGANGASYDYDVLDNLTRVVAPGRNHTYYYEPGTWRLVNVINADQASVVGLEYDVQGNLWKKNGDRYAFDYGNRLRSFTPASGSPVSGYVYDGHGRRARDVSGEARYSFYDVGGRLAFTSDNRANKYSNYIYLGGSLVATREWPHGGGTVVANYHHTDALGTPIVMTDANRNPLEPEPRKYEPFGRVINQPVKDGPGYTGHMMDAATELAYMQQRYYDPMIGRFLSVDPVTADNVGGNFNRYWYGNSNPYRFTDPDGRKSGDLFGKDEVDLGPQYVGRLDRVPGSDIYEIHVYKRGEDLSDAVGDNDTKGLRKQEVGVVGPDGNWVSKHGHKSAPTISMTANNRIRSAVAQEARARGWLGKPGTANIKGSNLARQIQAGLQRTGSLQHLKTLGKSLGGASVVAGYLDNLSIERACSMNPDFEAC